MSKPNFTHKSHKDLSLMHAQELYFRIILLFLLVASSHLLISNLELLCHFVGVSITKLDFLWGFILKLFC